MPRPQTQSQPRVIDNDAGEIIVFHEGHTVRNWLYETIDQHRRMMNEARWYVEGWCDAKEHKDKESGNVPPS